MAKTLQELEAERDRLVAILGKGIRSYKIGEREMEYASADQIRTALGEIERRIQALQGSGPLREVQIKSSKGL